MPTSSLLLCLVCRLRMTTSQYLSRIKSVELPVSHGEIVAGLLCGRASLSSAVTAFCHLEPLILWHCNMHWEGFWEFMMLSSRCIMYTELFSWYRFYKAKTCIQCTKLGQFTQWYNRSIDILRMNWCQRTFVADQMGQEKNNETVATMTNSHWRKKYILSTSECGRFHIYCASGSDDVYYLAWYLHMISNFKKSTCIL